MKFLSLYFTIYKTPKGFHGLNLPNHVSLLRCYSACKGSQALRKTASSLPPFPFTFLGFFCIFLHGFPAVLYSPTTDSCAHSTCVCVSDFSPPRRSVYKIRTSLRKLCVTNLTTAFRSGDPCDILSFWKSCWQAHPCILHPLKIWSKVLCALFHLHQHLRLHHCSVVLLWPSLHSFSHGVSVLARESWTEVLHDVP